MAEHGFLRPNPALFDLEQRKRKPRLAHEVGEGAECTKCGDRCSGFQLHYWRKVCINCRCGKAEHNVTEERDPGFYFVGKIFDRPLRSREEEMEFCYGDDDSSSNGSSNGDDGGGNRKGHSKTQRDRKVRFDWIPPNISQSLARRYLQQLPESSVPIAGSEAAIIRKQRLEKQFPVHDIEPKECHELTQEEVVSMESYIANIKESVAGQGIVTEVDNDVLPPPPSAEFLGQLAHEMETKVSIGGGGDNEGTVLGHSSGKPRQPGHLLGPKPYGSTSSSLDSSRNNSPSPTYNYGEDHLHHHHHHILPPSSLTRPNKFSSNRDGGGTMTPAAPSSTLPSTGVPSAGYKKGSSAPPSALPVISSSTSKTRCEECHGAMNPGDVAVKADRAGSGKMWHPQCFKCFACQEILVDLLYYFDSGRVFCARDFAAHRKIPRCHACDELIFAQEYTGAENKAWHLKHFCCYECDKPLAGHKYIPIDEQPHCLLCWQAINGKTCRTCGEYIDPEDQRVSLSEDWHWHAKEECFCCAICHTSLLGRKMTRKYDLVLCSSACTQKAGLLKGERQSSAKHAKTTSPGAVNVHSQSTLV